MDGKGRGLPVSDRQQEYPSEVELDAQGEPISAEDWLGNRFGIGDLVVYCISAGRGQMMAIGRVQQLRVRENTKTRRQTKEQYRHLDWRERQQIPYAELEETIDVPQHLWVVEVQILTERTSGHWGNERRTRPAWVNEMNITAVKGIEKALL